MSSMIDNPCAARLGAHAARLGRSGSVPIGRSLGGGEPAPGQSWAAQAVARGTAQ